MDNHDFLQLQKLSRLKPVGKFKTISFSEVCVLQCLLTELWKEELMSLLLQRFVILHFLCFGLGVASQFGVGNDLYSKIMV